MVPDSFSKSSFIISNAIVTAIEVTTSAYISTIKVYTPLFFSFKNLMMCFFSITVNDWDILDILFVVFAKIYPYRSRVQFLEILEILDGVPLGRSEVDKIITFIVHLDTFDQPAQVV
jgi:hypothetical protein